MSLKRLLGGLLPVLVTLLVTGSVAAADLAGLVANLVTGGYGERDSAITALAASGEARAAPILQALGAGELYVRNADKVVVIGKGSGKQVALTDAVTGKDAGSATEDDLERVKINNRLRGTIESVMGSLTLMNPDPRVRRAAAQALFSRRDPAALEGLDKAIAAEKDSGIKQAMVEARASVVIASDAPADKKVEAIEDGKSVIASINAVPERAQRLMLEDALLAPDPTHEELDASAHAWAQGNVGPGSPLLIEEGDLDPSGALNDPMLARRNAAWVTKLATMIRERPGTIFFAAGAGHFMGKGSVLDLLRKRGVRVERVQ